MQTTQHGLPICCGTRFQPTSFIRLDYTASSRVDSSIEKGCQLFGRIAFADSILTQLCQT